METGPEGACGAGARPFPRRSGLLLAALFLTGCSLSLPAAFRPLDGATVYRQACASCHGVSGTGQGPVATALHDQPADLTGLARRAGGAFPRARVIGIVVGDRTIDAHGTREMPVWNQRFEPSGTGATAVASIYRRRHLERLVAHIESLQR